MTIQDQAPEQSQPSIKDRIGALFTPETPQEQPDPNAPEAVAETEVVEQEPQAAETQEEAPEADPTADWKEVALDDGEKIAVPPKFEAAFMQQRDYTQKTQALADQRRLVEQREQFVQTHEQTLQQLTPLFAQAASMDQALQNYQRIDWNALYQQDPMEHNAKKADYAVLLQQRQELNQTIAKGKAYLDQQRQAAMAQAAQAALPVIKRSVPDWGPEKDAQLTKFALDAGAIPEELMGLATRPWAIVLLEKARKYDELQASRAQLPKAKSNSPVAKPGAKPTLQSSEAASYRKAQEQLRKSKGKDSSALRALIKAHVR